ncbi:hypothetical protein ECG_09011 [Echinococcus granulosus]|nr:hypothetical protein ECG_09011 [Echinococcus granulosus]
MFQLCASDNIPAHPVPENELVVVGGSQVKNPRCLTIRTELDRRKSEILPDIDKAVRMRRGAENMLHASERRNILTKAHKTKLEDELQVESATIGTLKDKMDCLNSEFATYQNLELIFGYFYNP